MNGRCQTVDATLAHMRQIIPLLRDGDRAEIEASGLKPRHVLFNLWRGSEVRKTVFVDGEIAAVWGCAGLLLSPVGEVWLFTTKAVERVPVTFLKEARKGVAHLLETKRVLVSHVMLSYSKAAKFMRLAGFEIVGHDVLNGTEFGALQMSREEQRITVH